MDIITIGDTSFNVFLEMNKEDAEVHCSIHKTECKLCLHYADKIPVEKMTRTAGGNVANVAVGSSRLGFKTALVTQLGKDEEAKFVLKALKADRVDTRFVKYDQRTNYSTVINYLGERTILVYHEHRTYSVPRLPKAKFMYLSSMKNGWETMIPDLERFFEKTKTKLGYNPGTFQLRAGIKTSQRLLDHCEILFVNKEEAALFLGTTVFAMTIPEMLTKLHKYGPKIVVITDGPKGSYASDETGQYSLGIVDIPVIERTGCGDSYATGFMAAIAQGKEIIEAMRWGSFNAWGVLQQIGPQAGLLTAKQMQAYDKKYSDFQAKRITAKHT
jgi:ribokinase